jgi:hypothetical protein
MRKSAENVVFEPKPPGLWTLGTALAAGAVPVGICGLVAEAHGYRGLLDVGITVGVVMFVLVIATACILWMFQRKRGQIAVIPVEKKTIQLPRRGLTVKVSDVERIEWGAGIVKLRGPRSVVLAYCSQVLLRLKGTSEPVVVATNPGMARGARRVARWIASELGLETPARVPLRSKTVTGRELGEFEPLA